MAGSHQGRAYHFPRGYLHSVAYSNYVSGLYRVAIGCVSASLIGV